jgi:hypothetical protein
VRASLPVEIVSCASGHHSLNDYHLHDISGGGLSLVGPAPLGDVDTPIQIVLRFDLQSTGKSEVVPLQGTIQNVELVHPSNHPQAVAAHQHGIKFSEVDARVVLLVHELQQRKV